MTTIGINMKIEAIPAAVDPPPDASTYNQKAIENVKRGKKKKRKPSRKSKWTIR
jgi:hypothetical protein